MLSRKSSHALASPACSRRFSSLFRNTAMLLAAADAIAIHPATFSRQSEAGSAARPRWRAKNRAELSRSYSGTG
jgi:hypothetical protein